jgi:PBP1b-binding outer membrane lipoprotein LpoB
MRTLLILSGALVLAGCGGSPEPVNIVNEAPVLNEVTGENDANTVEAMPDGTLRLTLARALAAADLKCDGLVEAERMADTKGTPTWRARCKNGKLYAISITPDGTANIISRTD